MRKLQVIDKIQSGNSLTRWWKYKHPIVVLWNCLHMLTGKYCPLLRWKNFKYSLTGMKIGKGTRIGLAAMFDIFFPELIEIGGNCIIGYNATILTHDFTVKEARKGKVVIGNNVLIGANATILAGVTIGDNSVISAMTLVDDDVPANCYAEGVPMKIMRKKKDG